jgi:death-on-curing protein
LPSDSTKPVTVQFLSLDEVLAIHDRLIEKFGGGTGIRDHGLLESALYRPQSGYYESLEEMATALFESLVLNHPFVDGNKRVAFFSTDVFLRLNGWKLQVKAKSAYTFLMNLFETDRYDFEHILPWIRSSLKPL